MNCLSNRNVGVNIFLFKCCLVWLLNLLGIFDLMFDLLFNGKLWFFEWKVEIFWFILVIICLYEKIVNL